MLINVSILYLMVWIPNLSSAVSYVAIAEANNAFGFKLYRALRHKIGNLFFSPLSTHMAVSMAYMGSRKNTAHNLTKVLALPLDSMPEHVGESYRDLLMLLQDTSTEGALNFASRVYVDSSAVIDAEFKKSTQKYFLAEATDVDFYGSPELASLIINEWVQVRTVNKIKDILKPESVTEETRMVLVSAMYFRGSWAKRFDSTTSATDTFQLDIATSKPVFMMCSTGYFFHVEYADFEVLALEYKDSDIVMLILLPKLMGLKAVEDSLQSYDWDAVDEEMEKTYVEVHLPRFIIEQRVSLSKQMNKTGLTPLFINADFSGITDRIVLKVDEFVHKACIDVNQEGSMGAPISGGGKQDTNATVSTEKPKLFRADHPFIFLIRHEISKAILFMGRFSKP